MAFSDLLENIRKLNNVQRWSNEFLHCRASVSEHSFSVAQIAQLLGFIEENFSNSVDWKRLYRKAINHDVPEAVSGDIISTTKNVNRDLQAALSEVEERLVNNMLQDLQEPYRRLYVEAIFDGKDDTLEGQILAAADNIDALIECLNEIKLANQYPFIDKYHIILDKIEQSPLKSVRLFLEEILPSLAKDVFD
jgi:putative hydrolase of HD superfamily